MSGLPYIAQVLKAQNWSLQARDTIRVVNHSMWFLCVEMPPNGLMGPSERLTALEVSSSVSQQVLVKVSTLKTGCCMPKIRYERSTARHRLSASLCLEMTLNGLKTPPERSTAPEVHP